MKGQVSTELMVIVALILLVFIPLLALVYFKANDASSQIASYEAELTVFRLAYLTNAVGSLGTNTTVYTDTYIPSNMEALTTNSVGRGGEIVMRLDTPEGEMEIVEIVQHRIVSDTLMSEPEYGWTRFRITSEYSGGVAHVEITKE
ncbi:TPA: hypothetical protein EYP38_00130 [Candidatus Micrarchaeota archaeon]|nr:hypothetical protein [Candidatus Micrarchaeota archaeon]